MKLERDVESEMIGDLEVWKRVYDPDAVEASIELDNDVGLGAPGNHTRGDALVEPMGHHDL